MITQFYLIAVVILFVFTLGGIYTAFRIAKKNDKHITFRDWKWHWYAEFSTELAGALIFSVIFGLILIILQQGETDLQLKEDLIRQLGSRVNTEAIRAAEELYDRGWHKDGTLRNAKLWSADLQNAMLYEVDLQSSDLDRTNFENANLSAGNLQNSFINWVNFKGANLSFANLQNSYLVEANLQNADLSYANLEGADLKGAILEGANLENAILPDGSLWNENADLDEFTSE